MLGEAATTAEGEAVFPPGLLRGRNAAAPSVVVARTDAGDMSVQELGGPAFDLSDRGAEGRVSPGPVEAYVYTDRGAASAVLRASERRRQQPQFDVRTFAADGRLVARPDLQWRVVRLIPHWDWWRPEAGRGGWLFHQYTTEDEVAHGTLDVGADGPARLERVLDWGNYRLVVADPDSGAASSAAFAVGWGAQPDAADVPDQLEVAADRAVAAIGQAVRVHVRGPFAGPARVAVESAGRVLESRDLALSADGGTVDLVASASWRPGVHVLAEAFQPLAVAAGAHDPVRAMGLAWVATDPAPHTLAVEVASPAMTAPRRAVPVAVHVAGAHGRAFVTLSAVDEGILQLTHFAAPDPVAALLGRTRFGLDLRDSYGRLLTGQANAGALREGGDQGAGAGRRGPAGDDNARGGAVPRAGRA